MDKFFEANAVLSVFSKSYMELKKGLPVRPSEMGLLNIIAGVPGPHTPVMLAQMLGVSKPMITAHLTALSAKGYVIKEQSPEDKRVYYVLPTERALELVEHEKADMDRQLALLMETMGEKEFDMLVSLAKKATGFLREENHDGSQR